MTTDGLAVALSGVLEFALGLGLIWNVGGAADWWIRYDERRHQLSWLPVARCDRDKTRSFGRFLLLFGLFSILIVVGGSNDT